MTRRDIIEAMRSALGKIGAGGLSEMKAIEGYATCWKLLGRLEGDLEMEDRRAAGLTGFPRPIIETLDPLTFEDVEIDPDEDYADVMDRGEGERHSIVESIDVLSKFYQTPDPFAGVEIDPLLSQVEVEAAYHAALAEAFDCEDSDANIEAVNDFLGRITRTP